ncbi:hypothetical protein HBK87_00005, partial [Streptomyces sp. 2BBP-J2]|uniref:hypothetical protein n=1 Tax=Streptomyces sp. 2BBP-J2 TaxID=2719381 RepID=UPI001430CA3D
LNPAHLQGTNAEVTVIQQNQSLLSKLQNPVIASMVIGPGAAMLGANQNSYNPDARTWEQNQAIGAGSGQTWIGSKDPATVLQDAIVNDGWNQYDEMTALLTQYAKQQGLNNWHQSPALKYAEKQVVAGIGAKNPAWLTVYDSFNPDQYENYLSDMETIVNDKSLYNDPARGDV